MAHLSPSSALSSFSPWPYRFALLTTVCTLPLLFVGGLVTSLGVGLAVPDWPTTFGYNMFLYPWSQMVGGIFYEHSHRLLGSAVGFLTILLTVALWTTERRPWMRWLGVVALLAVIVQGVLGGLRVVLLENLLALIHGGLAQAFFAFLAALTLLASAEWQNRQPQKTVPDAASVQRLSVITTVALYAQIVLGAVVRHTGSGAEVHILGAVLVAGLVFWLVDWIVQSYADHPAVLRSALLLRRLLFVQLGLGVLAYLGKYTASGAFLSPAVVVLATAHVVIGALMLATGVRLSLRSYRDGVAPSARPAFNPEQVSA